MRFNLNDRVRLIGSGESGAVVGRAEYTFCEPAYLIRYKSADGRQVEQWWTDNALEIVPREEG